MSKQNHLVRWSRLLFAAVGLWTAANAPLARAQSNARPVGIAADADRRDAAEGGLYAELVANRGFETNLVPVGGRVEGTNVFTPRGVRVRKWFTNDLSGWHAVAENGAEGEIAQDSESPSNERNPHSLRLTIKNSGGRFAVVNDAFRNLNVRSNEWVDLTLHIRAEPRENPRWGYSLTASLESDDGRIVCARTTLPGISGGGGWKRYTVALHARQSNPRARMVISVDEPGTLWLDVVSLITTPP
jgi:hypothetical protein